MNKMENGRFLGLDLSTQSLTAVVVEISNGDIQQTALTFDEQYPAYKTQGGVIIGDDPTVVHANPRMWVEAVDDILDILKKKGLTKQIRAIGVSAQQHGSVYLNDRVSHHLANLEPSLSLDRQLHDIFSRTTSPVWMDSSTNEACAEITEALGGDKKVAELTGSRATERFAGPQIRKFCKEDPQGYDQTDHIALISSFVTSLLIGRLAPLDAGDGFGMNLANVQTGQWSQEAIAAISPRLLQRLPGLKTKDEVVGGVSEYLVRRYGFEPKTQVIVGSGDNPCSLVGIGLIGDTKRNAISLGTSDTYFGYLPQLKSSEASEGHIFGTADGGYMALLCFKNGSLVRENVKNRFGLSWNEFSEILLKTPPGNNGNIILPYFFPEITPLVLEPEIHRFGGFCEEDKETNVRAIAEAQIMSMYLHSKWMGQRPQTILVTAGGSENRGLLKIISDVFNAEVQSFEVRDSAALGAAIRAAHCHLNNQEISKRWKELIDPFIQNKVADIVQPDKDAVEIYHGTNGLLNLYAVCEKYALGSGENPEERIAQFRKTLS